MCDDCVEGYFCPSNTTDYSTNICPSGYYCPLRTTDEYEYPCAAGTYNNLTVQVDVGACLPCPAGEYCAGTGNSYPTGPCHQGWYCVEGSSQDQVNTHIYFLFKCKIHYNTY